MIIWSALILLIIGSFGNFASLVVKKGNASDKFAWVILALWQGATAWGIAGYLP